MEIKVKYRLDEYLGFDCSELFIDEYVFIYGGAIRDSLTDQRIYDVDIMIRNQNLKKIDEIILSKGYIYYDKLITKGINFLYSTTSVLYEPHTYIKDGKIIQLIRPLNHIYNESGLSKMISNVDMSCCAISYSKYGLREHYDNALLHIINKLFYVNEDALMYSERAIFNRMQKMKSRGWKRIYNDELISINRELKLKQYNI